MRATQKQSKTVPNRVELAEAAGEWVVRVHADGGETVSSFELESYAGAFAEGQRLRFGLASVEHIQVKPAD